MNHEPKRTTDMASIAELTRQWGKPPEVVYADWAIQLLELMEYDENPESHILDEEDLRVDANGKLRTENQKISIAATRSLVDRWHSVYPDSASELHRAWNYCEQRLLTFGKPYCDPNTLSVDDQIAEIPIEPNYNNSVLGDAVSDGSTRAAKAPAKKKNFRPRCKSIVLGLTAATALIAMAIWFASRNEKTNSFASNSLSESVQGEVASKLTEERFVDAPDSDNFELDLATKIDHEPDLALLSDPLNGETLAIEASAAPIKPIDSQGTMDLPEFPQPTSPTLDSSSPKPNSSPSIDELPIVDPAAILSAPDKQPLGPKPDPVEIAGSDDTVLPLRNHTEKTLLLRIEQSAKLTLRIVLPNKDLPLQPIDETTWHIVDPSVKNSPAIAKIVFHDLQLTWQWSTAATTSSLANELPNAILFVSSDSLAEQSLYLRSPLVIADWQLDLEQGETSTNYALVTVPDRTTRLTIGVEPPSGIEATWDSLELHSPFRKGQRWVQFQSSKEKLIAVRTQFQWTGNHRFALETRTQLQLDPQAPWISANVPMLDARDRELEGYRLACQRQLAFLKEAYGSVRQEPQRTTARDQRERLESILKQIDIVSKRLTAARSLLHELQNKSRWTLDLSTPWANRSTQTILRLEPPAKLEVAK